MDNVQALEAQLLELSIGADPINDLIEIDAENRTILLPTTVINNSNAGVKLTYAADTKLYIDKKFAKLQAAITP